MGTGTSSIKLFENKIQSWLSENVIYMTCQLLTSSLPLFIIGKMLYS
jgi:hypothetical protein